MARSLLVLVLLAALAGCAATADIAAGPGTGRTLGEPPGGFDDDDGDDDDGDDDDAGDDDDTAPLGDAARGLDVVGISVNQGVQTWLMLDRAVANEGPIVAGRPLLLRVHVATQPGWVPRAIRAVVTWSPGGSAPPVVLPSTITPYGDSEDGVLASTFAVDVPAALVTLTASVRVGLYEVAGGNGAGNSIQATWPVSGDQPVPVEFNGGRLHVHVVPLRFDADGSGRLPDTSQGQLALLSEWLFRVYPTASVELTVEANPISTSANAQANGNGWGDLLYQVTDLRDELDLPDDVYIYGMFRPADDFGSWCAAGCVAGLSWRADDPNDVTSRASIGLGYAGEGAAGTLIHEVGHAHGRAHAPCGVSSPDPSFPYSDGSLGRWGWDLVSRTLKHPTEHRDLMGYCTPRWVSDYTWEALNDRIAWVNSAPLWREQGPPIRLLRLAVDPDGTIHARGVTERRVPPEGKSMAVVLRDELGDGTPALGTYVPFDDIDGGTIFVPAPSAEHVAVELDGVRIPLD